SQFQELAADNSLAKAINNSKEVINPQLFKDNQNLIYKKLEILLEEEKSSFDKGNVLLACSASLSPFIGLFGTVWGIYHALISIADKKTAGLDVIAGPIGEALVATAFGLFVAIPAAFFYNYFNKKAYYILESNKHLIEKFLIN